MLLTIGVTMNYDVYVSQDHTQLLHYIKLTRSTECLYLTIIFDFNFSFHFSQVNGFLQD